MTRPCELRTESGLYGCVADSGVAGVRRGRGWSHKHQRCKNHVLTSLKVESFSLDFQVCANESFVLQDGQIDYGEFSAMMRKGNGGTGRRTMRSKLNLGDALGLTNNVSIEPIDCSP
jgi:hypothetical protein